MKFPFRTLLLAAVFSTSAIAADGPFNGEFDAATGGLGKPLTSTNDATSAGQDWTIHFWIHPSAPIPDYTLLAGVGDASNDPGSQRYLANFPDGLQFWAASVDIPTKTPIDVGEWQMLTATRKDGTVRIYKNAEEVAAAEVKLTNAKPQANLAPKSPWGHGGRFSGRIALFTIEDRALSPQEVKSRLAQRSELDTLYYEAGTAETWPEQTKSSPRTQGNQKQPREALPKFSSKPQTPAQSKARKSKGLLRTADGGWAIAGPWKLIEAPKISTSPEAVSSPGFQAASWYDATVPGTVLTTLVDQGVYPDPLYGMNNLAIPESLNKQDYWYRVEFPAPAKFRHVTLTFNGINYRAEAWLNGQKLGDIAGAFTRGIFDITDKLKPGAMNALAVKVSPVPNPGVPHEQSLAASPGGNGGAMCLDGPTFFCSEGWDWIPGIRNRNTGIWQDVVLRETGSVAIGDIHVVTDLPLPDVSTADVIVRAELKNAANAEQSGTLKGAFDGVTFEKPVTVAANSTTTVEFSPAEFSQLAISDPRLWWPNGYGRPELYDLTMTFEGADGNASDTKPVRFGIREVSVELTALDPQKGATERLEYFPTNADGEPVIDLRHAAIVHTGDGWVPTLAMPGSPALKISTDLSTAPSLVIKVNGRRIPIRGGNWGMDDAMKRISRERLEPYVRLQRDANFNAIRNWSGQSMSSTFFELCDEYGLLVWNDFWLTTQDYNLEPKDPELFLANAEDTIKRFRNHPSIVIWCGRNEGVPPPEINEGLNRLIREFDGTRYYQPNSRDINMDYSGPWRYVPAVEYFTKIGRGFNTEVGLPSAPSADGLEAMLPEADRWPINDVWAYHDWHQGGNGDTKPFMDAMARQYGEPRNLADFSRKAQMLNYEAHRAMFEGMNANLWNPMVGRFMWMSHPSWPSTAWQLYAHDYEAAGAYFGIQKACERVHIQLNLPDQTVAVVNTTLEPLEDARVITTIHDANGAARPSQEQSVNVGANSAKTLSQIPDPEDRSLRFLKLELRSAAGEKLSDNFYWLASGEQAWKAMGNLPAVALTGSARMEKSDGEAVIKVAIANPSKSVALMASAVLRDAKTGDRILPAYANDNYISLVPGEQREIAIRIPASKAAAPLEVTLDGWNISPQKLPVMQASARSANAPH